MSVEDQLELIRRGAVLVENEEELRAKLELGRPLRIKHGADASSPRLHLGHAVQLRKLRQLQEMGHEVIFIVGDFTARIGDPSGKSQTRPLLSAEQVEANAARFTAQAAKILDIDRARVEFNSTWLGQMTFADVINLTSRATVARMLERDDFAIRFAGNRPISVLELLYPLVQGYDSVALETDIETGGTDQTFNFYQARTLMKSYGLEPQCFITMPLLEGTDGHEKMGKSLGNTIDLLDTPAEKFGKVMSLPDTLLTKYLLLCTDTPEAEIEELGRGLADGTVHPGQLKRRLAREIIALYDSAEEAREAEREFDIRHKPGADASALELVAEEVRLPASMFAGPVWVVALLSACGLVKTNSEARRMVQQGAVRVDGERVEDEAAEVPIREGLIVAVGKRRVVRVVCEA